MDPSRGDSRYNLNYSMSSIGLSLADQADMYGNPAAVAALGGRPPSGGLIQSMGAGGFSSRSGSLMPNAAQCQSLVNSSANNTVQQRGIKRTASDCYEEHHRGGSGGMTAQTLQGLESCVGGNGQQANQQQQQPQTSGNVTDVDDSYSALQNKKSPPANGKKTKGRVKIKMEYIDNKLRRYTTFSKRKTGIMKKAYELSTLTGTQVMLLVASETGHVYTFATRKLQPMITSEAGKQLIQTCLNSPDPPSVGGGDQRMSATGFEETELSYNIADEDSKEDRTPLSSGNESDDSSDFDSPGPVTVLNRKTPEIFGMSGAKITPVVKSTSATEQMRYEQQTTGCAEANEGTVNIHTNTTAQGQERNPTNVDNLLYPAQTVTNIPQDVLFQLIQSGHLQLHTEEDGSGHQYVAIPLPTAMSTVAKEKTDAVAEPGGATSNLSEKVTKECRSAKKLNIVPSTTIPGTIIKQELE